MSLEQNFTNWFHGYLVFLAKRYRIKPEELNKSFKSFLMGELEVLEDGDPKTVSKTIASLQQDDDDASEVKTKVADDLESSSASEVVVAQADSDEDDEDDENSEVADDAVVADSDDEDEEVEEDDESEPPAKTKKPAKAAKSKKEGIDVVDNPKLAVKDRPNNMPKGLKFQKGTNNIVVDNQVVACLTKKGIEPLKQINITALENKSIPYEAFDADQIASVWPADDSEEASEEASEEEIEEVKPKKAAAKAPAKKAKAPSKKAAPAKTPKAAAKKK